MLRILEKKSSPREHLTVLVGPAGHFGVKIPRSIFPASLKTGSSPQAKITRSIIGPDLTIRHMLPLVNGIVHFT